MKKNAFQAVRTYQAGMEDMFSYCASALEENGARIRRRDANLGVLEASVGWHLFIGSPCRIEVAVMPISPEASRVTVSSSSVIRSQFDWGRNRRIVEKVLETLEFIMHRRAVARGEPE